MSTKTKNYGLIKPELKDAADITAMNENWDKIDEALNGVSPDYVIEQNKQAEQKFWVGTKAEYDAIPNKDPNTSYTVTDEDDDTASKEYVDALAKPVLLWKNPSPNSELPPKDVFLGDVSEYSEYIVETLNHGDFRAKMGHYIHIPYINIWGTGFRLHRRGVAILKNNGVYDTLYISECSVMEFNFQNQVHSPSVRNESIIISAVYGVKGV